MDDQLILKKISSLMTDGDRLVEKLASSVDRYTPSFKRNTEHYQEAQRWRGACLNLLKLRFGQSSDYYKDFLYNITNKAKVLGARFHKENVARSVGVLEYVYDALENGLTEDLFYNIDIEIFSDILDQAFEFLDKKMLLAAAIYGRIVLEKTIIEFAHKEGVKKSKFDGTIIALRQSKKISLSFEKILRANYQIGTDAVHKYDDFSNYTHNDIKEFLTFIRDKVLTLG